MLFKISCRIYIYILALITPLICMYFIFFFGLYSYCIDVDRSGNTNIARIARGFVQCLLSHPENIKRLYSINFIFKQFIIFDKETTERLYFVDITVYFIYILVREYHLGTGGKL